MVYVAGPTLPVCSQLTSTETGPQPWMQLPTWLHAWPQGSWPVSTETGPWPWLQHLHWGSHHFHCPCTASLHATMSKPSWQGGKGWGGGERGSAPCLTWPQPSPGCCLQVCGGANTVTTPSDVELTLGPPRSFPSLRAMHLGPGEGRGEGREAKFPPLGGAGIAPWLFPAPATPPWPLEPPPWGSQPSSPPCGCCGPSARLGGTFQLCPSAMLSPPQDPGHGPRSSSPPGCALHPGSLSMDRRGQDHRARLWTGDSVGLGQSRAAICSLHAPA